MVCEDTLRIKNLPKELSDAEKEDFLRHFGAVKVKIITSKAKQKSVAFAKFETKEMAKAVLLRLHQLTILNCRLCVEYAENDIGSAQAKAHSVASIASADSGEYFQQFLKKLNSWNTYAFHQPPPPHLKYSYPRPNRATISNIGHALASVPKFYTQVLHLMNKMNLPPPFANVPDNNSIQKKPATETQVNSSEESEIESEEESANKLQNATPVKRKMGQQKGVKRPKFIKPNPQIASTKVVDNNVENVFDKVNLQVPSKIQLKLVSELPEEKEKTQNHNTTENGRGVDEKAEQPDPVHVISKEELEKGKLSMEKLNELAVFKNYKAGEPTAKIYIKNIAKAVEIKDLEFIFERYHERSKGVEDQFNIKLMKEGRMKGQAFITFNTVDSAQQALEETNGFVLKEKPLVVMFAKSASSKNS